MFALRGVAVSLTFFVLVYCLLSALVAVSWRWLRVFNLSQKALADLLFALRVFPLAASAFVTFVFVVPSFQLLEPRSIDEGMGTVPLTLGVCALSLIAAGSYRVITAQARTSRVVSRWLQGAQPLELDTQTVTFRSRRDAPPLTLVGLHRPRVLVSESTVALLTLAELQVALKHELAHMQSGDNLKKLVFRFCPFPGMSRLESAWSQTAELAADDDAVSNQSDAVDLAAALVKLSRLVPVDPAPVCTVGFVTGSIGARVTRLLAWNQSGKVPPARFRWEYLTVSLLVVVCCVVATYGPALAMTHEATEWLVR